MTPFQPHQSFNLSPATQLLLLPGGLIIRTARTQRCSCMRTNGRKELNVWGVGEGRTARWTRRRRAAARQLPRRPRPRAGPRHSAAARPRPPA
jgi:hypothetical protein